MAADCKIVKFDIEHTAVAVTPTSQREQTALINALLAQNNFRPTNLPAGNYSVTISVQGGRLVWTARHTETGTAMQTIVQSLTPYRKIARDYLELVSSYNEAVREAAPSKVETLDMARRGLHNEGAELLQKSLADKAEMDFETARRLFSIITTFYIGSSRSLLIG